jgi:lysophospholipase L1-like esterase
MIRGTAARGAVVLGALLLCAAAARADPAEHCAVPGFLLYGDSLIERATAAVRKDNRLKIAVLGGSSSTLPGPQGASFAYPARLQAVFKEQLPQLAVGVTARSKRRQSAAEAAENIASLLVDEKPNLVVWQTGTNDAVRGTDPAAFRATLTEGIEKAQAGGADVVLMNMQYSPRTETIVAVNAYADSMRWVAREREVPLFDRLAIMRHWYDTGRFNLYAATKDLGMAKAVHECIARALASLIMDAARLQPQPGAPAR